LAQQDIPYHPQAAPGLQYSAAVAAEAESCQVEFAAKTALENPATRRNANAKSQPNPFQFLAIRPPRPIKE